jgi:hypothetical protein
MSLARLGALALRGATPPGLARLPLAPAFDPIAALDAAAPMPAEAGPGARRHSPMARLAVPRQPLGATAAPLATPVAPTPARIPVQDAVMPEAALPAIAMPIPVLPTPEAPAARAAPSIPTSVAVTPSPPLLQPAAPLPRGEAMPPAMTATVGPSDPDESRPVQQSLQLAPIPRALSPAEPRRVPLPGAKFAGLPLAQGATPDSAAPPPDIHIGRIEVVMAPPPPAPPPSRPAPVAAPRDFSRYAAMRGARDRRG